MNKNDVYSALHLHTDYSLLDGLGKVEEYVSRAKEIGMPALAFTDHGTMAGLVTAYDECKKQGIKFVGGCEFYVAPDGMSRFQHEKSKDDRAYNHLIVLFKNETGYKNGCVLLTRSNTEGFYYKPRIDFELLKEHHEGLIVLSACVAGAVPQAIINGDMEKARNLVKKYKDVFGEDYYLEIQDHGLPEEQTVIHGILQLAEEFNVKIVATNDCHYIRKEDKEAHEWLLCMQTQTTLDDPKRMTYFGDYHLTSQDEMLELFKYRPDAVYNTQEVVDKCNFEFSYGNYRMPKVYIPEQYGNDYYAYLEDEAWKGFEKRYPEGNILRDKAKERLIYELGIIKQMGFAEYFLDIRKTILWCHEHNILVGPGRGSGAGSCMNYCIGITDIEPLQYDLLFERFLNPERISMPDIDTDFDYAHKDEVIASEAESNGKDCFAKIETFGTMKAKSVLKSCAKVAGIDNHVAVGNKLAKYITDCNTLQEEWNLNPELQMYVNSDENLQKIWKIALKLEGTKKSASTHACGHIPTPIPCEQLFPCRVDSETGYLVCEYDMTQAEHLGNLKKDLLMLRNLTIIGAAQELIKQNKGIDIPLWTPEILNDKKALEMILSGDTNGVFQLESDGMKKFMRQLQPNCFEDIIAGVALYRPGPMDYIPDYVANKHNPAEIHYATPLLKPILESTYGIIVYQEQVMLIVQSLAGFSMGRADVIRKAMGKKKQDVMDAEKPNFIYGNKELGIKGCVNNGISEAVAENIWSQMVDFAKYAFNKSHAAAYAAISMQTAYLKANYPHEFAVGLLSSVMDDSDKLMKYVNSYRLNGTNILPPDVNRSEYGFSLENGTDIRFGLCAIKGVGDTVAHQIPKERKEKTFESVEDFTERCISFVDKKALENLAKAGALDSFGLTRHTIAQNASGLVAKIRKELKKKDENQMSLFDFGLESAADVIHYDFTEYPEYTFLEKCRAEKEATGMYINGHPSSSIEELALKHGAVHIEDILNENSILNNNDEVSIYGIITKIKKKITKKGSPMMIVDVEDETGSLSVLVFESNIQRFEKCFEADSLIFLNGKVRGGGEDSSVILNSVCPLKDNPVILWIATKDVSLVNLEKLALSFKTNNPGIGDYLYICSTTSKMSKNVGAILVNDEVLKKAKIQFGPENVKVTQKKGRN